MYSNILACTYARITIQCCNTKGLSLILAVCAGTTMSVTSYDSVDKRSTITSPSNVISPLTSPNYATVNMTYTLPVPQTICEPSISPASDHIVSAVSLTAPGTRFLPCVSVCPFVRVYAGASVVVCVALY